MNVGQCLPLCDQRAGRPLYHSVVKPSCQLSERARSIRNSVLYDRCPNHVRSLLRGADWDVKKRDTLQIVNSTMKDQVQMRGSLSQSGPSIGNS